MNTFYWNDDFSVGDATIDGDHRKLFMLVDEVHLRIEQGDGKAVLGELCDTLIRDTREHLTREEVFMQGVGYPDFPTHKQCHNKLIETVQALQRWLDAKNARHHDASLSEPSSA
jgi:hemerythrin-like metal-binding protein